MGSREKRSVSMQIFGSVLRALREGKGVTLEELAAHTDYSTSLTAKIEYGDRMPSQKFIEKAEALLQAPGVLNAVAPHLSRERLPVGYGEYADREAEAVSLGAYDTHVIKGLLQTEAYARAVLSARVPVLDEEDIERRVEDRLARQALLTRKPVCMLSFVMEEWVLRRPVGGRTAQKQQLEHLLTVGEYRHVQIQILPTHYETHAGFQGPFTYLETPERQWLAYVEGQAGGTLTDDREEVSELYQRYGMIRTQALIPRDSAKLIEQIAGEL